MGAKVRANTPPQPAEGDRLTRRGSRPWAIHEKNPAGAKLLRRAAKAKLGKRLDYATAVRYHRSLESRDKIKLRDVLIEREIGKPVGIDIE